MSSYQSSNFAGEIWLQWFGCCTNQPAQQRKRQAVQRSRARIDRSTIGYPMNFQHTVHIGSGLLKYGSGRSQSLNEVVGLTRFRSHHRIMVPGNLLSQFNTLTHGGGNIATISEGAKKWERKHRSDWAADMLPLQQSKPDFSAELVNKFTCRN